MSLMFKTCSLLLVQVHLIKLKKKKKLNTFLPNKSRDLFCNSNLRPNSRLNKLLLKDKEERPLSPLYVVLN